MPDFVQPVYLNGAGHGLPTEATRQVMLDHMLLEQSIGPAAAALIAEGQIGPVRDKAASLLGCRSDQVALGNTTTQFWLTAVARLPLAGQKVLAAPHEWGTHYRYLAHVAPKLGIQLEILPEDEALDPSAWAARIDQNVAALLVPLVTSAHGVIYPLAEIAALPRPDNALIVVDAAQAAGRIEIPRGSWDILATTARKWLRAPRNTAICALSDRASAQMGVSARDLEPMDTNNLLRLALGSALDQVHASGIPAIGAALHDLTLVFRSSLADAGLSDWVEQGVPNGAVAPGHLTLAVPNSFRPAIDHHLSEAAIIAKWADSEKEEPLSALAKNDQISLLRITPNTYNGQADAELLAQTLKRARSST